jgi:hypothetical protein
MRRLAAAIALAMTAAWPALAGPSDNAVDLPGAPAGLPRPADSGKPAVSLTPPANAGRDEAERCLPALPCGTLLLGDVRKNGAVELRVPALRW